MYQLKWDNNIKNKCDMKKALFFMIGILLTVWFTSAAGTRFKDGDFWYEPINDTEVELVRYEEAGRRDSSILPSRVQHDGRVYTVVSIGKNAVHGLLRGDTIIIPNTVRELKDSAFYRCPMTTVEIPNSVKHIGKDAFCDFRMHGLLISDLSHWLRVKLDNICSNPMYFNDAPHYTEGVNNPFPNHGVLFVNGKRITKLVIPADIDTIGDYAFAGYTGCGKALDTCIIGDNVKHIGSGAFRDTRIKTLILGKSLKSIGSDAFMCCDVDAVYADKATWLGIDFANGYSNPVVGRALAKGQGKVYAKNLYLDGGLVAEKLPVPNTLREIKDWTFAGCRNLVELKADSLRRVGTGAFWNCDRFRYFTFGDKLTDIGSSAFGGCFNLESAKANNVIKNVGDYAFYNCSHVTELPIGEATEYIGESAFRNCKIKSATIGKSIKYIGECGISPEIDELNIEDMGAWLNASVSDVFKPKKLYVGGKEMSDTLVVPESVPVIKPANIGVFKGRYKSLVLSKDVERIEENTFNIPELSSIKVLGAVPPVAYENSFMNYGTTELEVPEESREAYMHAFPWYWFTKFSGVAGVSGDGGSIRVSAVGNEITVNGMANDAVIEVYTMGGQQVYKGRSTTILVPGKGIYLLKSGGQTIKVVV